MVKALFKNKNSIVNEEPRKLFLKVPMKDLTDFKLSKSKDSKYYKTFIQNFNDLDDYDMREEEESLCYLVYMHNDIIEDWLPRIQDGGLYVLLTAMTDTIKTVFYMCKDYTNIHRIKLANCGIRLLLEDSYRYKYNHKCTYNIWKNRLPDEWYERLSKYSPGAHSNYDELIYSVKEIKDDIDFCMDAIVSKWRD